MDNKAKPHKSERGRGTVYEQHGAWHLQFYTREMRDGQMKRVRRSVKLHDKDREHNSATCKAVRLLRDAELMKVKTAVPVTGEELKIVDFWTTHYLPYCNRDDPKTPASEKWKGKGMKPSTIKGYKQVWNQHLAAHFGAATLQQYTSDDAYMLLQSLKTKLGKNTLKHIRALASAMFAEAIDRRILKGLNPWHVRIPKDAIEPEETPHYTLEQAEDMISALADHVDAQLVLTLACFVGLRRGEIAALKWEDCDGGWIHIRRSLSDGEVGAPKSKAALAPVPLVDQVRVPLELWRAKCGAKTEGWMFHEDGPLDINNMLNRVIIPHVNGVNACVPCNKTPKPSGVKWRGLHAGRRGVGTMVIAATGNIAVAQAMLRHEKASTTANMYKKELAQQAFSEGIAIYQKSLNK
jgi:integrase